MESRDVLQLQGHTRKYGQVVPSGQGKRSPIPENTGDESYVQNCKKENVFFMKASNENDCSWYILKPVVS